MGKWYFCILVLAAFSCTKHKREEPLFTQNSSVRKDSVVAWLEDDSNFVDHKKYMAIFYENYYKRLREKDINGAAHILHVVANKENCDTISKMCSIFLHTYEEKVASEYAISLCAFKGIHLLEDYQYLAAIPYLTKAAGFTANNYIGYVQLSVANLNLATAYLETGKPDSAFFFNTKAVEYNAKTDFTGNDAECQAIFARIDLFAKKYTNALRGIEKALSICKAQKDWNKYYTYLFDKAEIYLESGYNQDDGLIDSLYDHFKNEHSLKKMAEKVSAYSFFAAKKIKAKQLKEAKIILDSASEYLPYISDDSITLFDYTTTFSRWELSSGKCIGNSSFYEQFAAFLKQRQEYNTLLDVYEILKEDAKLRKDYKKALYYDEEIAFASDKLFGQLNNLAVLELEKRYKTEKKEHQILLQKKEIDTKQQSILALIGILFLITLAGISYYFFQKQKRLKLQRQASFLFTQQLLEKTEEERKRIATDLHDSISHELLDLRSSLGNDHQKQHDKIDNIINDIRIISRNLHPVLFEKVGLQNTLEQMVERVQLQNHFMLSADIQYKNGLPKAAELQVYRIVQEAVSNMIKYAKAVAGIITIHEKDDEVMIEIKDNGVGFDVNNTLTSNKSFGLQNIFERSKAIGGTATIVSNQNGTTIRVTVQKK